MKRCIIVYHGTDLKSSRLILKEGFRKNTYFAQHLEDAVGYGGPYVFEVALPTHLTSNPRNWQFTTDTTVPPEFIICLTKYNQSKIVKDNAVLRHMVCISNQTKAVTDYMRKDIVKNPTRYSKEEKIAYGIVTVDKKPTLPK